MATTAFGSAGVTASSPHRGPFVGATDGFGGVARVTLAEAPPPKPRPASTVFGAAVAADPARQTIGPRPSVPEPLEILDKPRPAYIEEARQARIEGDVVLEMLFTKSGTLRVLRVVRGLGYGLEKNATDAAAKIHFLPAKEDGHAVDTVAMVRISFQMAY